MMRFLETIKDEIECRYGCRFSSSEKEAFCTYLEEKLNYLGLKSERISTNIVTKVDSPIITLMAHYDTPGKIPDVLGKYWRFAGRESSKILIPFIFLAVILLLLFKTLLVLIVLGGVTLLPLIVFSKIKNETNLNDNTSGVLTLLSIAYYLKDNSILKDRVQFVFTNYEEKGLKGAKHLNKIWGKYTKFKKKLILNFDSVGVGDILVISNNKKVFGDKKDYGVCKEIAQLLGNGKFPVLVKRKFSSSDYLAFPKNVALSFSMVKRAVSGWGYYLPNIHTSCDRVINLEGVSWLSKYIAQFVLNFGALQTSDNSEFLDT